MQQMPDWTSFTTISQWFLQKTPLEYRGIPVIISAFTPDIAEIFDGDKRFNLPIEAATKELKPINTEDISNAH